MGDIRKIVVELQLCYEMDPDKYPLLRMDGKALDIPSCDFPELTEDLTALQASLCSIVRDAAPYIAKALTVDRE
jgi:hypothetical protein